MGSHITSIVVNLFMEQFETKATKTTLQPSRIWPQYVDDTFGIQKVEYRHQFLQHIKSIFPHIHFTAEVPNTNGSIPFQDTLVSTHY